MRCRAMMCESCKERPATITIKQGHAGGTTETHFCEKCAFQLEQFHMLPNEEPISIQQLLSQWFGGEALQTSQGQRRAANDKLVCVDCELSYNRFLEIGKFGCATCYETFRAYLPTVFGKLHSGNTAHTGKIPLSFNKIYAVKRKIEDIRLKMQEAVVEERFEEAASLRDEANALQAHLDRGGEEIDVD